MAAALTNVWNDVRYGARSLATRPTFTIVAALTLALGIGVNVASVIVNQRFAERLAPGEDPVGRPISVLGTDAEIIGLAADAKDENVTSEIEPQVFMPDQSPEAFGSTIFYVRAVRSAEGLLGAVRETAARADPLVPITNLRTMRQQVRENLATQRYAAGAASAFAILATLLAALGLYGVLAYAVAQRSREIGLRFALGAPAHRIRGMVLRQMAAMTLVGIGLGVVAAWRSRSAPHTSPPGAPRASIRS